MSKYRVRVYQEHYGTLDPREGRDHLGTMACWHSRYTLGDEQPSAEPMYHQISLLDDAEAVKAYIGRVYDAQMGCEQGGREWSARLQELYAQFEAYVSKRFDAKYISLPLYLYDHSGLTMSTGAFSCPWDSGQVGFIYVSRAKLREALGWPRITKAREQEVLELLRGEVEEYDNYLQGNVWSFVVEELAEEPSTCPACGHESEEVWLAEEASTRLGYGDIYADSCELTKIIAAEIPTEYGITESDIEQAIDDAIC